jgi:hypothetical protein
LDMVIIGCVGSFTFSYIGVVESNSTTNALLAADGATTIPSIPEADIMLKTALDMKVANLPNYQSLFYNCNMFVAEWENYGITETANLKNKIPTCP